MAYRLTVLIRAFVLVLAFAAAGFTPARAAETDRSFSPKNQQEEIGRLRDFFYPPGYSDDAIVALENGKVPSDMTVAEFSRLHCGESIRIVLNPCMVRYTTPMGPAFFVVTTGGNKTFTSAADAAAYFNDRMTTNMRDMEVEVEALNNYIEAFCADIDKGLSAKDALAGKGDRPRLNHAIAAPNPEARFPFSNLFQWEKCDACVGIVAVRQDTTLQEPRCGTVRKQNHPRIAFFVVDRTTSKGYGSLGEGLKDFGSKSVQK